MSVYIKGMEMPRYCAECDAVIDEELLCPFTAGKKMVNRLVEYEQKEITIMNLTGYTLDYLIQLSAAGYILIPPAPTKDLSPVFSMHLNERKRI